MRHLAALLALYLPPGLPAAQSEPKPPAQVAITQVTVIDATGAPARPDMTVVISRDRITDLGKAGRVVIPPKARRVDGKGKFLIPGLWDMHVHAFDRRMFFPLFLANGVTGVRDMFDPYMQFKEWRKEITAGKYLGPHLVGAGPLVDGPNPFWPGSLVARDAAEGRKAVGTIKRRGADFVKVYSKLPRAAYFAIAAEARKQGIPFAGHVPEAVSAAEASDAGQKSMEHLYGIALACSTHEKELRHDLVGALAKPDNQAVRFAMIRANARAGESYDAKKAAALFARFAKNGTWQCPTLPVLRSLASLGDKDFTSDPRVKYVSPFIRQALWGRKFPADVLGNNRRVFRRALRLVGAMHKAGVGILAGTDTPNPYCFPGFSLHDELALLVQAGLTPMEALQCATRNPAKFLGKSATLGTVEKGKLADLVLLDANPLEDIRNTRKIGAVVLGGQVLARAELQKMLAEVEAAAKK
jgi:imidazolonepropionase-like amidohydrolase